MFDEQLNGKAPVRETARRFGLQIWGVFGVVVFLSQPVLAAELYHEPYRPAFHFTAKDDYINDPVGLFWLDGVYHLCFQHHKMGDKAWGQAISRDLVHWKQLDDVIVKDEGRYQAFSGSAFVDTGNKSGLQKGPFPPVIAMYTAWGKGNCLAYSVDGGKTFLKHPGNPVLKLPNDDKMSFPLSARDPEIFWYEPNREWVMVLYQNLEGVNETKGQGYFTSTNLVDWKFESHQKGFYVCPDLFELPVDGDQKNTKWVVMDWEKYKIGQFDGKKFVAETDFIKLDYGKHYSANQTWENDPGNDHQRIQIAWIRDGKYPGMKFNQQMAFPCRVTLKTVDGAVRLCRRPVDAIETLYTGDPLGGAFPVTQDKPASFQLNEPVYDIEISFKASDSSGVAIEAYGQTIAYDSAAMTLECLGKKAPLKPIDGSVSIRILIDRTSLEVFGNDGHIVMTNAFLPNLEQDHLVISTKDKPVSILLDSHQLRSAWEKDLKAGDDACEDSK